MNQNNTVYIDILSDPVCPWCAIGYYRLRAVINKLNLGDSVQLNWQPFELNPNLPSIGENLRQHLAKKYGTTLSDSIAARKRLTELGQEVGFEFNYTDDMRMLNTRKAHILLQWTKVNDRQTKFAEALFKAYFTDQQDISNNDILLALIDDLELNVTSAKTILTDSEQEEALVKTQSKWLGAGFHAVPAMIFNGQQALQGAQDLRSYEHYLKLLA